MIKSVKNTVQKLCVRELSGKEKQWGTFDIVKAVQGCWLEYKKEGKKPYILQLG